MNAHSERFPRRADVVATCREALRRGPLVRTHPRSRTWAFGRRRFADVTVSKLIEAGEAVRDGNTVRSA